MNCQHCEEDGTETLATRERWGEPICETCEDRANEQAHEASLDAYYGGGGCQSDRERFDVDSMNRTRR